MCECTLYFAGRLLYDGERKNKNRNGDEHRVYKQLCKISGEENVLSCLLYTSPSPRDA